MYIFQGYTYIYRYINLKENIVMLNMCENYNEKVFVIT